MRSWFAFSATLAAALSLALPAMALAQTAHDPGYDNATLWPVTGPKPEYMTQKWEPAPLYVWATPGEGGAFGQPENWLVDGKPATTGPNETVDVLLPDADKPYSVGAGRHNSLRHLTIGRNAGIKGGHRGELQIWGNGWIKDGGYAYYIAFGGPGQCFFRIDNSALPSPENKMSFGHTSRGGGHKARSQLSHKLQVCKYGDGSVEFMGKMGVSDEIMVQHGRLIVSGDLRWSGVTNKGALEVYDGATLELQSGATIGAMTNINGKSVYNLDVYRNGTIQAGSKHRPLTDDAKVLLGYGPNDPPGKVGLFAAAGSMLRVFSADPTQHQLVFTAAQAEPDYYDGRGRPLTKDTPSQAHGDHGIALQLAGDTQFDGVHFDYVSEAGIKLLNPDLPKAWRNVTWGEHNAADGDKRFGKLTENANEYYHDRGDAKSEWGLTKNAVASMEVYMRKNDPYRIDSTPPAADASKDSKLHRPQAIEYRQPIEVTLTCEAKDAKLYYTLDGSEPTEEAQLYTGPIRLAGSTRIRTRAYAPGKDPSAVFSVSYVIEAE